MRLLTPMRGLRGALITYVLAPLVVVLVSIGWLSLDTLEQRMEQRMQEDIELIARAIRLPLSTALEDERQSRIQESLDSAFRFDRVYGAYVYDQDGHRIAASGPRQQAVQRGEAAIIASDSERLGVMDTSGLEPMFSYFVPLTSSGERIIGLLQVTRRGNDFQHYLAILRIQAGAALLVLMLLVTGIVLLGHYGAIGRHLQRLTAGMARIGGGDRTHRVPLQGPQEIMALSRGMNDMLDNIAHSEAKLAEQRNQQAALEARLRHSEKMAAIGQLSTGIAHELGTPMNVIDGQAQRALRNDEPASLKTRLRRIRAEVRRMEDIVRQLMDFSGRNPLDRRPTRADRLARSVAARISETTGGALLELDGATEIPPLLVDRRRIEQALVNLVRNALQATPVGTIRLSWFQEGHEVVFSVEDDGPGIPPDARNRIFEPFFTTKPVGQGTGLGLSVTHSIAEEHGGRVEIADSSLGGACLRLVLPSNAPAGETDHG